MALLCDPQRWPLHTAGWGPALPPVPLALRAFPAEIASSHAALAGSPSLGRAGRGGAGGWGGHSGWTESQASAVSSQLRFEFCLEL